ncbi:hypothetical protein PTSG_07125 [Salpingoeca rosetta]|uniref:Uncharacterized protein n=1 Tax=Salpingoeca rosetta (strain ATCC 50818 / BSB-021) TaxID=946362 RepID=F2UE47_SALR5|nr:uncharacterized protein PTSG_07125 [Salpingoeca rosetta]EGD74897.1 hypothetical protein PTSG_07125 [Salpingoeca rosetta]|eukprot:XP_004992542.1 hypothetical protein PTSG_07125 [Salpingoeca rosetta]
MESEHKYAELPTYEDVDATPVEVTITLPSLPFFSVGTSNGEGGEATSQQGGHEREPAAIHAKISPQCDPEEVARRILEQYKLPDLCLPSLVCVLETHQHTLRQQRLDERDDALSLAEAMHPTSASEHDEAETQQETRHQQAGEVENATADGQQIEEQQQQQQQAVVNGAGETNGLEEDEEAIAQQWADAFANNCKEFRHARDVEGATETFDEDAISFSERFHELIHSPLLNQLLQLEDGYASYVQEMISKRDRLMQKKEEQQLREQEQALAKLEQGLSARDITDLARQHTQDRETHLANLNAEIKMQKELQKRAFRDMVLELSRDTADPASIAVPNIPPPSFDSRDADQEKPKRSQQSSLFSKFTFGRSGSSSNTTTSATQQQRTMQRSQSSSSQIPQDQPEQEPMIESFTVMLGTQKKVEHNLRLISGNIIDTCGVEAHARTAMESKAKRLATAMSLYSTELRAVVIIVDTRLSSYSGAKAEFAAVCERSTDLHFAELPEQIETLQVDLMATHDGGVRGQLSPGDFYITRHSNLADAHVVFHLVADDEVLQDNFNGRSKMLLGLRNIIRCMFQNDIQTITLPLLLLHSYTPEMDDRFCERRCELILKTIKGFIMENTAWGRSSSKTIQLMVPKETTPERFAMFVELTSSIFRETRMLST